MSLSKGLVEIYTGDGKGKTTCAFGLAMRACGRGIPVFIVQFMKTDDTGEFIAANKFENLKIYTFGTNKFVDRDNLTEADIELAKRAMEKSFEILERNDNCLLILDEINNAINFNLVKIEDCMLLIEKKSETVELVLTGRNAPAELIEKADLVTEMREIKHPWRQNIPARKGIEW